METLILFFFYFQELIQAKKAYPLKSEISHLQLKLYIIEL